MRSLDTSSTQTIPTKLSQLRGVQAINSLEQHWISSFDGFKKGPLCTAKAILANQTHHQTIISFLKSLYVNQSTSNNSLYRCLIAYRKEIGAIYEDLRKWLIIYFDLTYVHSADDERLTKILKKLKRHNFRDQASQYWLEFDKNLGVGRTASESVQRLLMVKDKRDRAVTNSQQWRNCHHQLVEAVYDELNRQINELNLRMHKLFERVLFRQMVDEFSQESNDHTENESIDTKPDSFAANSFVQRVEDWISGYHPASSVEKELDRRVFQRLSKVIKAKYRTRLITKTIKVICIGAVIIGCIGFLKVSRVDNEIYETVSSKILKLLSLDPASVRLNKKRRFFYDQIKTIKTDYSEDKIFTAIKRYDELTDISQQEKAYLFAEKILKGYLLLLPDWNTSQALKDQVLKRAWDLDEDIHYHVTELTEIFAKPVMHESHLRQYMFKFRLAYIQEDVFPFMFLSLYKDRPYIFLYPERIVQRKNFGVDQLKIVGLNQAFYSHYADLPLVAYIVQGINYPFDDRAGYFEGEYAIVFDSLAPNPDWTAWHEFGHSTDEIRYEFGAVPYLINVEVNSMLFPIIFGENPEIYARKELFRSVYAADYKDLYVQSAKGILNGFVIHQRQSNPSLNLNLIEDDFDKQTIRTIEQWIHQFSAEDVRSIAKDLYKDPGKYLYTAKGGTYRGIFSNREEVIEGIHGAPTQGFLLDGIGKGDISFGTGSKFIREGSIDFEAQKDLWTFIKLVIHMVLNPTSTVSPYNSLESIVSTIVVFILIELLLVGIQLVASPIRKRKYNGVQVNAIVKDIYTNNPWSDGQSVGEERGERLLLAEIFKKNATLLTEKTINDIEAFKSTTNKNRRVLFDVCMTLAPWIPKESQVKSKWHNLLFWLPFLGPVLGRWPLLYHKQKAFVKREAYNQEIRQICKSIQGHTSLEDFLNAYKTIVLKYKVITQSQEVELSDDIKFVTELEQQIHVNINDSQMGAGTNLQKPMVSHRVAQSSNEDLEFDRLDKYVYGDDIKRIDWRATARAVNNEPIIRKSTSLYGANIGFLFDFRDLHDVGQREKFANDFNRSLRLLGKDKSLKQIIFIMPNGEIFNQKIHIKLEISPHARAAQLWERIKQTILEKEKYKQQLNIMGLNFYSEAENRLYCERYQLTEFQYRSTEGIAFEKLSVNNLNIFLIGMSDDHRSEVPDYLSPTNQVFHW